MCLFPIPNLNYNSVAYKKGVTEFDCGACPECQRKRSNLATLTSVYEARQHVNACMVTLTYDNYARDDKGHFILDPLGHKIENPVDPDLKVNKRDIQLFLKRLRKWYNTVCPGYRIKYRACAEYGSRTHRAHYHVLLFGVRFPDLRYYKKSKRGNVIYTSSILTKLWSHGICTVDSTNVRSAVARYCTKYLAKSRSLETFSLCSHGIGVDALFRDFNGIHYMIDGREYPIPRSVWQLYIFNKYKNVVNFPFDYRYINKYDSRYEFQNLLRENYRNLRDGDSVYLRYCDYWRQRGLEFDQHTIDPRTRLLQLPYNKFRNYITAALGVYDRKREYLRFELAPGSLCGVSKLIRLAYEDQKDLYSRIGVKYPLEYFLNLRGCHLPFLSCPNTASDTDNYHKLDFRLKKGLYSPSVDSFVVAYDKIFGEIT